MATDPLVIASFREYAVTLADATVLEAHLATRAPGSLSEGDQRVYLCKMAEAAEFKVIVDDALVALLEA